MEENSCSLNQSSTKQHKPIFKHSGYWDGEDENKVPIGGPLVICIICNEKAYPTWEGWKKLPDELKAPNLAPTPRTC